MKEGWGKETGGPCRSAVPARASSSPADTELSCSKQTYPSMPRWVRVVGFPHRLPEGLFCLQYHEMEPFECHWHGRGP